METDFAKIGLKVGIEIHQQLATSQKLFCRCPPELFKEEPETTFLRRLRPTQSELGQIDPAAFFEFQKGIKILYESNNRSSCLVEMDEEPPHALNMDAVEIALTTALMMNATPVDEIHVMRKTVIDGSNTTGFQRTCVVALGGSIIVERKQIPIQHASLEEDAARKIGNDDSKTIRYRIDRLGIPLIEVTTGPVINSPQEAQKVALAIGRILRDTGRVMRGLGTIRQDLNVSIPNGALVEIKGVQELELISRVIEYEVQRQLSLLAISRELKKHGVEVGQLTEKFTDVTEIFAQTKCKVISNAIAKNDRVFAAKLNHFRGFLKRELMPNFRLGTEMADRARFWGRVGGIFHTDELPAYNITNEEVESVREAVGTMENDAIVFVADSLENATDALRAVIERAKEALAGVPPETRAANPDGTSRYMRPRPGAARMYPETDIPTVSITKALIAEVKRNLPEPAEAKKKRLKNDYGLNDKLANQVVSSEYAMLFEEIAGKNKTLSTTLAVFLTETLTALKREAVQIDAVSDAQLKEIFHLSGLGEIAKEAIPEVFIWLSKNEGKTVKDAIIALGLRALSEKEVEEIIDRTIIENRKSIEKLGEKTFGMLMGLIMKETRGKIDARIVAGRLKVRLSTAVEKEPKR